MSDEQGLTDEDKLEGLPVAGYQAQTILKVARVNENKWLEEQILRRMDQMQDHADVDQRWLAIARTQMEVAFMAMNRSIFQPQRVELPEELAQNRETLDQMFNDGLKENKDA